LQIGNSLLYLCMMQDYNPDFFEPESARQVIRFIFSRMPEFAFADVSLALTLMHHVDPRKSQKFLDKLDTLVCSGKLLFPTLAPLVTVGHTMADWKKGTDLFWPALKAQIVKAAKVSSHLEPQHLMMLIKITATKNPLLKEPEIWSVILKELERHLELKSFDHRDCYEIVKHAGSRLQLASRICPMLVAQGADADELAEMGTSRAITFIDCLSTSKSPDDERIEGVQMFLVHIKVYVMDLATSGKVLRPGRAD
jgi:hypothetical protein